MAGALVGALPLLVVSGSASGASNSPSGGGPGVTNTTITVGGLETQALFGTGLDPIAKAVFNQANASGQIPGGRKIEYVPSVNDQSTTDGTIAAERQLVEQDHVFAVVPMLGNYVTPASVSYLATQQVPGVGWATNPAECSLNPNDIWIFSSTGCPSAANYPYAADSSGPEIGKVLEAEGKGGVKGKTIAIVGENDVSAESGVASSAKTFAGEGYKVVYAQSPLPAPPAQVTDYAPYVQALMTADGGKPPDVISQDIDTASEALGLTQALSQAGYKGVAINYGFYSSALYSIEKGTYVGMSWATPESTVPAMKQIVSTITGAGIPEGQIGIPQLATYFAATEFVDILKKVGPDLTGKRFDEAASHYTFSIPGVVGPTYYPQGALVGPSCGEVVYDTGTKYTIAAPYFCTGTTFKKESGKLVTVPYPSGVKFPS